MTSVSDSFPLATETNSPSPDDNPSASDGASGPSNSVYLPVGGMIAIIVVIVIVSLLAVGSGTLFYMAKKREMRVRELVRHSTKKVIKAITPRRSTFAKELKDDDNVPPTPALPRWDVENASRTTASRPPKANSKKDTKYMTSK